MLCCPGLRYAPAWTTERGKMPALVVFSPVSRVAFAKSIVRLMADSAPGQFRWSLARTGVAPGQGCLDQIRDA
jgi:hypothetical protein